MFPFLYTIFYSYFLLLSYLHLLVCMKIVHLSLYHLLSNLLLNILFQRHLYICLQSLYKIFSMFYYLYLYYYHYLIYILLLFHILYLIHFCICIIIIFPVSTAIFFSTTWVFIYINCCCICCSIFFHCYFVLRYFNYLTSICI